MAVSSAKELSLGVPPTPFLKERSESLDHQSPRRPWRASTVAARSAAVDRVILEMRERLEEPLSLRDMADIAYLSPFHFNRVFRQMTGVSPCRFLTTLRMEAAKRFLLNTDMRVTDVCFAVGYNSLGTFTTQFTQLIGVSPGRYRRLRLIGGQTAPNLVSDPQESQETHQRGSEIEGWISVHDTSPLWIFVGLFPTPVPAGDPVACTLLTEPGLFHLTAVPEGPHYLRAAAVLRSAQPSANHLIEEPAYVSASDDHLIVRGGRITRGTAELQMRPSQLSDPPILMDLPLVLASHHMAMADQLATA